MRAVRFGWTGKSGGVTKGERCEWVTGMVDAMRKTASLHIIGLYEMSCSDSSICDL